MSADKRDFYEKTAKRLAASTKLYKVDSIIHVEDTDDIWFWRQLLTRYRVGRYKFMPATTNEKGNRSTGCEQCLKYKDFLSQRFFICIDSDLRYLAEEGLSAEKGVLQTYTYSWENHCAFAAKLQQAYEELTPSKKPFDFSAFLLRYSKIVYRPFLLMLYQKRNNLDSFKQDDFRRCITLQYQKGDEENNGSVFLQRLSDKLIAATQGIANDCGFCYETECNRYARLGLHEANSYLYVRGHCLYDALIAIGEKLSIGTGADFEQNVLKGSLAFEQYPEIARIKTDIGELQALRQTY